MSDEHHCRRCMTHEIPENEEYCHECRLMMKPDILADKAASDAEQKRIDDERRERERLESEAAMTKKREEMERAEAARLERIKPLMKSVDKDAEAIAKKHDSLVRDIDQFCERIQYPRESAFRAMFGKKTSDLMMFRFFYQVSIRPEVEGRIEDIEAKRKREEEREKLLASLNLTEEQKRLLFDPE